LFSDKDCSVPKLKVPNKVNSTSVETIVLTFFSGFYSEDGSSFENIVLELLQKLQFFPDYAVASSRTSVFLLCFIILDGAWIISAVSLLSSALFAKNQTQIDFVDSSGNLLRDQGKLVLGFLWTLVGNDHLRVDF
jgi:hypothetical protein